MFLFLRGRKEALIKECVHLLEKSLSQTTQMDVRIGKVSGSLLGFISLQDVRVSEPGSAPAESPVLTVKELQFRYRFLDFLSKKFDSKVAMIVKSPELRWRPYVGIRRPRFPVFGWMREWAFSRKNNFVLSVENMSLLFQGTKPVSFKRISARVDGDTFHLEWPLSHLPIGKSDVSSVIVVDGKFDLGSRVESDLLVGQIHTEGTVIDWKPISRESAFNFVFSPEYFRLSSTSLLAGIQMDGGIDFTNDYNLNFSLKAQDVPMSELAFFMKLDKSLASASHFDLEADFDGNVFAPHVEARARLYNGWVGPRAFKAMDLNVEGVYPTVKLNNSRILLEDGSTMLFANKVLEIGDLTRGSTFEMLISESQQNTVVWGDWEFSRPVNSQDKPEFFMQRSLGENTLVHFKKTNEEPDVLQDRTPKDRDMEVGFEYKLQAEDSLKIEYRDDQEVVGVLERKLRF